MEGKFGFFLHIFHLLVNFTFTAERAKLAEENGRKKAKEVQKLDTDLHKIKPIKNKFATEILSSTEFIVRCSLLILPGIAAPNWGDITTNFFHFFKKKGKKI